MSDRRLDLASVGACVVVFVALVVLAIDLGPPLGHDESVYALRAAWATGDESVNLSGYWADYRAPGLPWVLSLIWLVRATEPFLRATVAAFGAVGIVLAWALARNLFGRRAALLTAGGMAVSPWWVVPSSHVWPDVPGATLGLATLAVLVWAAAGERVRWWALLAAPLAVLTTIVRFGAPLSLVAGVVLIVWWRWEAIRKSWLVVLVTGLVAVGGTALVLFTTLVSGGQRTPYRAIADLQAGKGRSILEGFEGYVRIGGPQLASPVAVALLVGAVAALLMRPAGQQRKALAFVGITALATFVILATTLHAELRYLSPVVPFVWMFAGYGLAELSRPVSGRVLVALVLAATIPFVVGTFVASESEAEILKDKFTVLKTAMETTDWPDGCRIATSFGPQVGWYSRCQVVNLRREGDPVEPAWQVTHIVDVFESSKEPVALDEWLVENALKMTVFGDPDQGSMRSVAIYLPEN